MSGQDTAPKRYEQTNNDSDKNMNSASDQSAANAAYSED